MIHPEIDDLFKAERDHYISEHIHHIQVQRAEKQFIAEIVQAQPDEVIEVLGINEISDEETYEQAIQEFKKVVVDLASSDQPVPHVRSTEPQAIEQHAAVKMGLAEVDTQEDMWHTDWYVLRPTDPGRELIEEWDHLHQDLAS